MNKSIIFKRTMRSIKFAYIWTQKMFRLQTRENFSYWSKLIETFEDTPIGFYAAVEENVRRRKIPGLKLTRVTMAEGNFFSPRRKYLRLRFQSLIVDVCAARHGSGDVFISSQMCRINHVPLIAKSCFIIICLALLSAFLDLAFGWQGDVVALVSIAATMTALKREASGATLSGLFHEVCSGVPFFGGVYQNIIRPDTQFRRDQVIAFEHAVQNAIMQSIDKTVSPECYSEHSENKPPAMNLNRVGEQ
jgi:hypothetical protein